MKDRYWFRASRHGIGWVPVTWQGWWIGVLYLVALVYSSFQVDSLVNFIPRFLLFSALLIIITYLKGEPIPRKKDTHE